jgi:tyrosinase
MPRGKTKSSEIQIDNGRTELLAVQKARTDELVEHPTFFEHVRHFFDPIDVDHMRTVAKMDLASYEGVKSRAAQIFFQTSAGQMPPEPERRWSDNRVKTFRNWMVDKFPLGVPPRPAATLNIAEKDAAKMRPDASKLTNAEDIEKLKLAFKTLMERDSSNPQSYFTLAGIHWFPEPTYCVHREPRYNPWHRVYVDRFEAALRTVPGCEDIRLPYWDILKPIPDWLYKPPFDSYTLPQDVSEEYKAGHKVTRFDPQAIYASLASYDVASDIRRALNSTNFEAFTETIERAHNGGHLSIGPSGGMGDSDVAAFDPIFWFFHCNWERMWWSWQKRYGADTPDKFRSTVSDQTWLDDPLFNSLDPFGITTLETIDTSAYAYEEPALQFTDFAGFKTGNIPVARAFRLDKSSELSIRVKGIERLRIPGSFAVHLFADGKSLTRRAVFQSSQPAKCANCVKRSKVNVDIIVDKAAVEDKHLEVRIETLARNRIAQWVPLSQVGSPTINVRELLVSE